MFKQVAFFYIQIKFIYYIFKSIAVLLLYFCSYNLFFIADIFYFYIYISFYFGGVLSSRNLEEVLFITKWL